MRVCVCVLVLFPVIVCFVRQSSLSLALQCRSKTSWSREQTGFDMKTLFLDSFSHATVPSWAVFTALFTTLSVDLERKWDNKSLRVCVRVRAHAPVLPAVLGSIVKRQTGCVVHTWCVVIHALQSCKRQEMSQLCRLLYFFAFAESRAPVISQMRNVKGQCFRLCNIRWYASLFILKHVNVSCCFPMIDD